MPIKDVPLVNPFKPSEQLSAWYYLSNLSFNHKAKIVTATYEGFADKESAYSGGEAIDKFNFAILPTAQSGVPSYDEIMSSNALLFGGVATAVDTIAMNYPIFASGTLETPVPPSGA